ncbi:MAG TPA: marine proteobacterial sortase target protein [Nitrospirales bacterium]|jgi:Ca-activated chloride channel family protein
MVLNIRRKILLILLIGSGACATLMPAIQVLAGELHNDTALTPSKATQGSLLLRSEQGVVIPAPVLSTDVEMKVTGPIVRATVRQQFQNPDSAWAEGIYVFPLPEEAAVDHLRMRIGERIIEGIIKERTEAKKTYEAAKAAGKRASLVEQERPNIFTTSVANIGPQETITVEIEYQQLLHYDQGQFRLRFPMVVGPRYIPGMPLAADKISIQRRGEDALLADSRPREKRARLGELGGGLGEMAGENGTGWAPDTDAVPDASRITPPVEHPSMGTINPVTLTVNLAPGFPLARLESPYHKIKVNPDEDGRYTITLQDGPVPADRDFELVWQAAAGKAPETALFSQEKDGQAFALFMVLPPAPSALEEHRLPRETIFVIDTSGSMHGASIEQAKAALRLALLRLRAEDSFNIIQFNSIMHALFTRPVPVTRENLDKALRYVNSLQAQGGTEMLPALQRALDGAENRGRLRQIIFLTDGAVGNEDQLFSVIRERLGDSRLFTVGIGSAPNSHFMHKAAEFGRGSFTYIGSTTEVQEKMGALFRKLEHPALTDINIEMSDSAGVEILPERIPDLYLGEPLIVSIRASRLPEHIRFRGRFGGAAWETTLPILKGENREGLSVYWARQKIGSLTDKQIDGTEQPAIRQAIVDLSLKHHLVSRYTSLVAVEMTQARPADHALNTHAMKTNLPEGWSYTAVFGLPQTATHWQLQIVLGLLGLFLAFIMYRRQWHRV